MDCTLHYMLYRGASSCVFKSKKLFYVTQISLPILSSDYLAGPYLLPNFIARLYLSSNYIAGLFLFSPITHQGEALVPLANCKPKH